MISKYTHIPVLAQQCYDVLYSALAIAQMDNSACVLVDATVGLGGHTRFFLERIPQLHIIGIDRDEQALEQALNNLADYRDRIFLFHGIFNQIETAWQSSPWRNDAVRAVLADFGVSSLQLDNPQRGFSYAVDAPLDMRMDTSQEITCAQLLDTLDKRELSKILYDYGDEKFSHSIAGLIVKEREKNPIERTSQLVDIIYRAIPAAHRRKGGHPAKRTFQALRIAVNAELTAITQFLPQAFNLLAPQGRLACISFQSLEDKIVKKFFHTLTHSRLPVGVPFDVPHYAPQARDVLRGGVVASEEEKNTNARAASARLRAIEKLATTDQIV